MCVAVLTILEPKNKAFLGRRQVAIAGMTGISLEDYAACLQVQLATSLGVARSVQVAHHSDVRRLLQDRTKWGWFLPYDGCLVDGKYVCKNNVTGDVDASANLWHDEVQTPGWTGRAAESTKRPIQKNEITQANSKF